MSQIEIEETIKPKKTFKRIIKSAYEFIQETFWSTILVIGIVILIRFVLVSPFEVNGGSMLQTLQDGDYIIVDKISYRFSEPQRGDIVVLVPPVDTDSYYVKRIIALPGEEIEFNNGQVLIHNGRYPAGVKLEEEYLSQDNLKTYLSNRVNKTIKVPDNQYFVMGDNRGGSNDSRQWGTLHSRNIEGRAALVVLPIRDFGVLEHAEYEISN